LSNPNQQPRLTAEEYEVRIWGFVVIVVTLILAGIVFALLYSVTFVVQPIKTMAPIDMAYTKMLNDIVLLVVGGIGGVMSRKGIQAASQALAGGPSGGGLGLELEYKKSTTTTPVVPSNTTPISQPINQGMNWMNFKNPDLDESWVPPPPPTTPATHLESDDVREEIANARAGER
jgi:hypothetical protein